MTEIEKNVLNIKIPFSFPTLSSPPYNCLSWRRWGPSPSLIGLKETRTAPFGGWVQSGVDFRVQSKGEHMIVPDFSLLRPIIRQES